MADLETLLIKQLSQNFEHILKVASTSDVKLLSVHDKTHILRISSIKYPSNVLSLANIKSFAWQEDNYYLNEYRLLAVNKYNEICYYVVKIKDSKEHGVLLEETCLSKWNLKNAIQQFHELAKQLEDMFCYEILKYEAKETVFLFDKKIVVSFFLSPSNDPQVMSISDLSDGRISHKKVLLMKEILFALDSNGTKLYIYSFTNNAKIYEIGLSDCNIKYKDDTVQNFSINLKLDLIVFITKNQRMYSMSLNLNHINATANPAMPSTVTAFTKQYPSVRRLDDSLRRYSILLGSVQPISFTCDTSDLFLQDLFILENKLFFLYRNDHQSLVGIHVLDADEPTVYKILPHQIFFISTSPEEVTFPLLLFYDNKISLLLYGIEQDKLVNELMIYPSSGAVETLASLNNWNSIQMDIEVLRLGLSNRKIYTVEFYLKTLFEGFCQQWNAPVSLKWFEKVQKECTNWENILHLVSENVHKNLSESITCQYAEQLLQIVIVMVIQILDVIEKKDSDESFFPGSEKSFILSNFSKLLLQMRRLLRVQDNPATESAENKGQAFPALPLNSVASDCWKRWENVSTEDIIQESLLNGTIPLAQSYFQSCCDDEDMDPSFGQFEIASDNLVLYFLRHGLIPEAINILMNMGIDINSKLLEIFKSTPERDIRELMVNELRERNLLTDSEIQLLTFVSLLEKLYPCTSFEHARMLLAEKSAASVNEVTCVAPYSEAQLTVGDFMAFNQDNNESGSYCRIVLNWVDNWDEDIKSRILAPHFLRNSPVLEFFSKEGSSIKINPLSLWYYLLENGRLAYLLKWIDTWLQSEDGNDSSSIFGGWPINEDMIDAIPERASLYISDILLNKLASHGVFCEEELKDISLFLARTGRSQCDVNEISVFSSKKASLTFSDLMHRLVHYCLKHHLVHLLFSLLSQNYKKFSLWPSCSYCDVPLLNLTKAFYLWSQNHNDSELAYDAVARIAQYNYNLKSSSPSDLLLGLPLPLCLSIFLFKSQPLTEIIQSVLKDSEALEQTVKQKFLPHPLLYNYLFKSYSERYQPDVTIYELLKDSTKFDTSQLFGWQSDNALKSEDSMDELPHFSLKSLSEQYGLKKELNYLYYLMQGRPNYAYLKFIQHEVVLETGLSVARIKSACADVTDYALANYRNSKISVACVLFIELAGQDSLPLRACSMAANMLHDNRTLVNEQESGKSSREIWKVFKFAYQSKDSAAELVSELEKIVLKRWDSYSIEPNSLVKDICLWMPVMTLSHLFEVEAGSMYLNECAKQNKWLKFLVFSQIFQIPKDQVLKAASKFSNSCIYYHIFHALHKKPFLCDASNETKSSTNLKPPTKDMRMSLYSRIGVGRMHVEEKKAPDSNDDIVSISSEETSSSDPDIRPFVLKDLFSQLLLAHSSDCPWDSLLHTSSEIQNPVLAILAASYPDAPLQSCFFIWLYTTLCLDECTKKQIESFSLSKRITAVSTDDIETLILLAVQNEKILILWQAVQFFLPTTPLMPLMEFLKTFLVYKKFDSSVESFQNQLWDYPRNSENSSVLHSALWIENISVAILKESVIRCSTSYERVLLLQHFSHTRLEKSFSKEVLVPPFMKVCHMLQYTDGIGQDINVQQLFLPDHDLNYQNVCWTTVKKLLKLHLFHDAEMFATVAKLPIEDLFLLQMKQTVDEARENVNWSKLSHRINFWKAILDKLNRTIIPLQAAVEFLENQCEISDMYGERFYLMKFVVNLLIMTSSKSGPLDSKIYDIAALEKKMWWWCIKAEVKNELLPEIFDVVPMYEFDFEGVSYNMQSEDHFIVDIKEREALGSIINRFLFNKDLKTSSQLASTFGYKSPDLEILQTCLQLAKEELDINDVNIALPDYSVEVPSSRFISSLMLWLSSSSIGVASSKKDVVRCIENLGRKSEAAISICHQILVHYIVSIVLKRNYIDLVKEKDTLSILKQILTKKLNDEHILAKSFISVRDLPDRDVAVFLSQEIQHSLEVLCLFDIVLIPDEQLAFSEELIYDPLRTNESFQLIVKLCQDPSVLGRILMDTCAKETSDLSAKSSDKAFSSAVELCICAHECFTAACNTDGISQILHNSQILVKYLEEANKFSIMVRLLIGLGRFSEMVYVFDVLKTHDKLLLLFVKKNENAPSLRLALLDYLKRLPPSEADNYFYKLAKTFGMYREKAEILEMSVQKQLSQLCKKNLDNKDLFVISHIPIFEDEDQLKYEFHSYKESGKEFRVSKGLIDFWNINKGNFPSYMKLQSVVCQYPQTVSLFNNPFLNLKTCYRKTNTALKKKIYACTT